LEEIEEIAIMGRTLRGTRDDYEKCTGRGARHESTLLIRKTGVEGRCRLNDGCFD
jgi:hypothetical protein